MSVYTYYLLWAIDCKIAAIERTLLISGPYITPLDMKECICHFVKWQIHPFISKDMNSCSQDLKRNKMSLKLTIQIISSSHNSIWEMSVLCQWKSNHMAFIFLSPSPCDSEHYLYPKSHSKWSTRIACFSLISRSIVNRFSKVRPFDM